jgi:hypothetical protein
MLAERSGRRGATTGGRGLEDDTRATVAATASDTRSALEAGIVRSTSVEGTFTRVERSTN